MAEPLWGFEEARAACGAEAEVEGVGAPHITSVSIDSRTLEPGALFVAIRGETNDGHAFVGQAFDKGAACAMVATDFDAGGATGPLLRVPDTLAGLEALGRAARARTKARVIAVTGSVGKTGTKEALRLALSQTGATHASRKSYNNQWGVPLSLAEMPAATRFGVFEIGMNHPGEITPLTGLVRPHVAVITTVEPVHLGYFSCVEEIAEAKAEIFSGLEPGGTAILNRDNPHYALLAARAEEHGASIVAFGRHDEADVRLLDAKLGPDGSDVTIAIGGKRLSYRVGAPGEHLVLNSLGVLAAAEAAGADLDKAAAALTGLRAPPGRGERSAFKLREGTVLVVDEAYNANPASMRAALAAMAHVAPGPGGRRIAVLGDMLELGGQGPALHEALAGPVDEAGVDVVFACGPLMAGLFEALPEGRRGAYAAASEGLTKPLLEAVRAGDVVMIKGSLGSRMGPVVEALKAHLAAAGQG